MTRDECILLGSITKTHGIRGELILRTADPSTEPEKQWEYLFIEIDGIMVPFFISRLHRLRNGEWAIQFDGITDRSQAESITGHTVWTYKDDADVQPDGISFKQLEGHTLYDDTSGKSGIIKEFLDIPGNPVLNTLIEGKEMLVPVQEKFIVKVDEAEKKIRMQLPPGLI